MSPKAQPVAPEQPAFLEGGRLHPIQSLGDLALIRCCRCTKGEIAIDRLRVHVRPGHPHEATIDGEVHCLCGWRVRIERGLCYEIETEPWLTDPTRARSGKPIVFPPIARVPRVDQAQGFAR
jgi:hypothetical protein